jgi:hypothetical protein
MPIDKHDGVEPLRIVALVDCDRVRERVAAADERDDAETAAGIARQPGVRQRMDVLRPHPVA